MTIKRLERPAMTSLRGISPPSGHKAASLTGARDREGPDHGLFWIMDELTGGGPLLDMAETRQPPPRAPVRHSSGQRSLREEDITNLWRGHLGERVEYARRRTALRDSAWCSCQPIFLSRPAQSTLNSSAPDIKPAAATRMLVGSRRGRRVTVIALVASLRPGRCARAVYGVPTSGRRPASASAGPASLSRFPCCLLPGGMESCRRERHLGVFRC
jgi:hypothetical protein